jgi:crotonobetainyl-CoA:carnitine CoA-transferase CaiB-like acyl-CoA transferase
MIEVATAVTAEQVIEHSAHGRLPGRRGARGVHRCAGDDAWIAIDRDADPMDDGARAAWCASRSAAEAEADLLDDGIPAAAVVPAFLALDDPQLVARDFFQALEHPVVGTHHYPGWPARLSGGPRPGAWWTGPAPRLDEHTGEVLGELLGMDETEVSGLRRRGVVGNRLGSH